MSLALAGVTAAALIAAASPAAAQPTGLGVGPMCAFGGASSGVSAARGTAREPLTMAQSMQEVPASALAKMSAKTGVVSIPIYFHIITDGTTGLVSDTTVNKQIVALNNSYSGQLGGVKTGFRFRVAGVDHTNNAAWFAVNPGDPAEKAMKRALHKGGSGALNVYTASGGDFLGWATFPSSYASKPWYDGIVMDYRSMPGGPYGTNFSLGLTLTHESGHQRAERYTASGGDFLGWATFPSSYSSKPWYDGIVMDYRSMPGGPYGNKFSLGLTLTHESGHWLGLYHTFQGGCGPTGDLVADTPAEKTPTSGCPANKDTCNKPGKDPVHNFMDYSYDSCYTQFTAGQRARMQHQWNYFRAVA